jgi:predicted GNAT family N-acyltransferase
MLRTAIVKHKNLTQMQLEEICEIKSISWAYSIDHQKEWLNKNMLNEDEHFLIYDSNNLTAYLNIVNVKITINGATVSAIGIGNVCTRNKGRGLGAHLMEEINKYIMVNQNIGLLFCKDSHVKFYEMHNWKIIPSAKIVFTQTQNYSIKSMIFNFSANLIGIVYADRMF